MNNEVYPLACLMAGSMLMARSSTTDVLTLKASKHSLEGWLVVLQLSVFPALCSYTFSNSLFTYTLPHFCWISSSPDQMASCWNSGSSYHLGYILEGHLMCFSMQTTMNRWRLPLCHFQGVSHGNTNMLPINRESCTELCSQ